MKKAFLLLLTIIIPMVVNAQSAELKEAFAAVSNTLKEYKFESEDVRGCSPSKVVGTKSISILLQGGNIIIVIDDDMRRVLMDNTPIDFYAGKRHGKKNIKIPIANFSAFAYGSRMWVSGGEGIELTYNSQKEILDSYTIVGAELSLKKLREELTTLVSIAKSENFNGNLGVVATKAVSHNSGSSATKTSTSRNKTIKMRKMAGNTYEISCKVNGLPLNFIFDTGASSVTLSRRQAIYMLRNGYLSQSDIIGSNAYQTASGDIAIGTVIKLRRIEINGLVLNNVEASIINSDSAPLLLGQSALSRLGKIQIDYKNSTLTIIR